MKLSVKNFAIIIVLAGMITIVACSTSGKKTDLTLEERMQVGMKQFDKKNYLEAKNQFRIITLSYSGHTEASKAQYYLSECHYNLKEYILAGSEYERLLKVYPNSEWVDDAKYKLGMCYFKLSPRFNLDQEYTLKAIREFQEFLEEYRTSPLVATVQEKLNECRDKLAHKVFAAAEQYYIMNLYDAAVIYYTMVLDDYYDSKFSSRALFKLGDSYRKMNKIVEAIEAYQKIIEKYPKDALATKAKSAIKILKPTILTNEKGDVKK